MPIKSHFREGLLARLGHRVRCAPLWGERQRAKRRGREVRFRPQAECLEARIALAAIASDDLFSAEEDLPLNVAAPGVLENDGETAVSGTIFHVASSGNSSGNGTVTNPWDLQTALNHPASVQPGDTIWLHEGTYAGGFTNELNGTASDPIVVRSAPGEWARLDMNDNDPNTFETFTINGSHTHFVNFEVFSSDTGSRQSAYSGSWAPDQDRGSVEIRGDHITLSSLILHDMNKGIGFWKTAVGGELNSLIIFNNGWWGTDRFHGPGIYTQNTSPVTKQLTNNIIFNQFYNGLYVTGTSNSEIDNYFIEGNVSFNNGAAFGATFNPAYQALLGGGNPADNIVFRENSFYVAGPFGVDRFGFTGGGRNVEITDNYFHDNVLFSSTWEDVTFTGNTLGGKANFTVEALLPADGTYDDFEWDNNRYYATRSSPFKLQGVGRTWDSWRAVTGLDANSTISHEAPSGTVIDVRANEYEPGGGHAVIYNFDDHPSVQVDISSIVPAGASYEIRNVLDIFGAPLVSAASYDGGLVAIPMNDTASPSPIGFEAAAPHVQSGEFGVFVIEMTTPAGPAGELAVSNHHAQSTLGALVTVQSNGSFTYDGTAAMAVQAAAENELLVDTFQYTAQAATGADTATVSLTITGANDAPVAADLTVAVSADNPLTTTFDVDDIDSDDTTASLNYAFVSLPAEGSVQLGANGTFTFDPGGDFSDLAFGESRQVTFAFQASDQHGASSNLATVTATVTGGNTNGTPRLVTPLPDGEATVAVPFSYDAGGHFSDDDPNDTLTYSAALTGGAALPGWLSLDSTTGQFGGTPSVANTGTFVIDVTVTDLALDSISDSFVLAVTDPSTISVVGSGDFLLRLDATGQIVQVLQDGTLVVSQEMALTSDIRVSGADDLADSLEIDLSNGIPIPAAGVVFDGLDGAGVDSLEITGGSADGITFDFDSVDPGAGSIQIEQGATTANIAFFGLEPITVDTATVDMTFNLTDNDDVASLRGAGFKRSQLSGATFEDVEFRNPTGLLAVNGALGEDSIEVRTYTLYGTSLELSAETVNVATALDTNGGDFHSTGGQFVSENNARILTDGGDVVLAHDSVQLGDYVLTGGGDVRSSGSGAFEMVDTGVYFRTNGGTVSIDHSGDVTLRAITTSRGTLDIESDGDVWLRGAINTRGSSPGHVQASGVNFTLANGQRIYTSGGEVTLSFTGTVSVGELIQTSGGNFTSSGPGPFEGLDTGATLNTGGTGGDGNITIDHGGDVTIFAATTNGGMVNLNSGGNVQVRGNITSRGGDFRSAGSAFNLDNGRTISTGGGDVNLQHSGTVTLDHSLSTGGGSVTSLGAGDFVALDTGASIRTTGTGDGNVTVNHGGSLTLFDVVTGGGSIDMNAGGAVWMRGRVDTSGIGLSDFSSTGASFTTERSKTISTGGGSVSLEHSGSVTIGASITTTGGSFTSTGSGEFVAVNASVSISTSGYPDDGAALLDHDGDITTYRIVSGGGDISLLSRGVVNAKGWVDARGLPGDIIIQAAAFTSANGAPIWSNGGTIAMQTTVATTVGEYIRSNGGNIILTGDGPLTSQDAGAYIKSFGGDLTIDHRGTVDLKGALDSGGGRLDITLHVSPGMASPQFSVLGNLNFNGGVLTIDMDGNSVDAFAGLPVSIEELIAFTRTFIEPPAAVQIIDRALGDPDFAAGLLEQLDKTLDLILEAT